ncbi:MAG: 3-phenylpropionate/cinnamic acid dioxygenase subunit beta [Pseudolabrys sp.]|nr:3-phenylpropionate/cinnamic acid dioxygenase subunit beta [Pseudolabrys sp.]
MGFYSNDNDALLLRLRVEEFLTHEASLVDERRYEEWLSLFADDLEYRMPLVRNLAHSAIGEEYLTGDLDVSWFDEDKQTLATRIAQIRTGVHWAEEPLSRTTRIVTNLKILDVSPSFANANDVQVASKYIVNRNRTTETDDTLIGKRVDRLRLTDDGWLIYKRTVYINQTVLRANSLSFFV